MRPTPHGTVRTAAALAIVGGFSAFATPAAACNTEPYIGTICTFAFDWCPRGYVPADGRSLTIRENTALFGLIGFMYGGDNVNLFNIPDLRGRVTVGKGQGTGLIAVNMAQKVGQQEVVLSPAQTPVQPHTHPAVFTGIGGGSSGTQQVTVPATPGNLGVTINASNATGTVKTPSGNMLATVGGPGALIYAPTGGGSTALASDSVTITGTPGSPEIKFDVPVGGITGGTVTVGTNTVVNATLAVPTQPPSLGQTVCIAISGLYPSRPD